MEVAGGRLKGVAVAGGDVLQLHGGLTGRTWAEGWKGGCRSWC